MAVTLAEVLKDTAYHLDQFEEDRIDALEQRITARDAKNGPIPYVHCLVRGKPIKITPEEVIRQLYLDRLLNEFHYPLDRISVEYTVSFGREKKRSDICIF